jgi:hypothetical protein
MVEAAENDDTENVMLPDLVMTGVKPAAESGPVIVTVLPEELALKPLRLMAESMREATVFLLLLDEVEPLMISTPFTLMLETEVLPLPPTSIVAMALVASMSTIGVNPAALTGPVIVTVLELELALYPVASMPLATRLARVLELVVAEVPDDMICVPFTVMPPTSELWLPEKVTRAVGSGGVVVMTGVTPAAEIGPLIVTVLPEAVAL